MRKNLAEAADQFFKERGLEEELKQLMNLFTERYTIDGEETEDLREALRRAPDHLIDMIWGSVTGEKPDAELSRQQKEERLYTDIPGYFESRFDLLEIGQINLLTQIMCYEPIDTMKAVEAINEFVPYGWVFYFTENGNGSFVVMKEVADIIQTLKEPEVVERVAFMGMIRYVVKTCLALYGVCTLKQIEDIFLKVVYDGDKAEEEIERLSEIVKEFLPYLEEQEVLWLDGDYILSPHLASKKEYRELLRRQDRKYYVPDQELVLTYGSGTMLVKNEEYERVFQLLTKETKDRDETERMLEKLAGYVTREDYTVPELVDCLYDWGIVVENDRAAGRLIGAMCEWTYGIRRWSECGYSRKELHKENADLKYAVSADQSQKTQEMEKKIYPNDPCPCGSGKKYKKCCGRK